MTPSVLARAAASGMLLGAALACGGQQAEPAAPKPVTIQSSPEEASPESRNETAALPAREEKSDPNCCAGKNECKGLGGCAIAGANDCAGKNECKGKGGCKTRACPKTEERTGDCCKGLNECKGKGGCKTAKNDCAGKNECKGQGGCRAFCPR
jgi:hypothetical protein